MTATEPDFIEDGFYIDFSKILGYFYGDIVVRVSFGPALQEAHHQRR